MPDDRNEPIPNEETVVQPLAPESSEPHVGEDAQVQAPAEQAVEEQVAASESNTEPTDEEQTEHSEPESSSDGASTEKDKAQALVEAKPVVDPKSVLEQQPYEFEKCTIQIAIQLLPDDGDAKGRPILLGLRSHLDAPIVQMLRLSELEPVPLALLALIEQLKSELPTREQAAKERLAKAQEEALRKNQMVKASGKRGKTTSAKPEPPPAPAPKPSVLTDEQRANAVAQVAPDEKQQLALF